MRPQRPLFILAVFIIALSLGGVVAARSIPAINVLGVTPAPIPATDACFTATLTGSQEVPPVTTSATGLATAVFNASTSKLSIYVTHTGLISETMAHIHTGAAGVDGPVLFDLGTGSPKFDTFDLTLTNQIADLANGNLYVNIHTSANSGGEIRGQLLQSPNCYAAVFTGENEKPNPVPTTANGYALFAMSADQTTLIYDISYGGLSGTETVAHFHKAALGVSGPVVYNLPSGSPKIGYQALSGSNALDIQRNQWYVNIHTNTYPTGEIRGQILPATNCFTTVLSGANEVPANTSTATGQMTAVLSPQNLNELTFYATVTGLSTAETAAHFHRGAVGVNGPNIYDLPAGSPKAATQAFTAADVNDLRAGLVYINIHTSTNPGGEVRGQLLPTRNCLTAKLSGANEVPATSSTATGVGVVAIALDNSVVVYDISHTVTSETMAHFHRGKTGANGPVAYGLALGSPKRGNQAITPTDLAELWNAGWYINIHSTTNASGEIRGQLIPPYLAISLPNVVK
jgi:CHRD domain